MFRGISMAMYSNLSCILERFLVNLIIRKNPSIMKSTGIVIKKYKDKNFTIEKRLSYSNPKNDKIAPPKITTTR